MSLFGNQDMLIQRIAMDNMFIDEILRMAINDPVTLKKIAEKYFDDKGKPHISYQDILQTQCIKPMLEERFQCNLDWKDSCCKSNIKDDE